MENLVDYKKINNDAWLERKYLRSLREKILVSFLPFYCSNMNIDIFDKSVTQPCVIHNNVTINKDHYGILLYVQNIIKWLDSKYDVSENNSIQMNNTNKLIYKTSYIHTRDVTTRLHLHCHVPTISTTSNDNSHKQNARLQFSSENLHVDETDDISDILSDIHTDIHYDIDSDVYSDVHSNHSDVHSDHSDVHSNHSDHSDVYSNHSVHSNHSDHSIVHSDIHSDSSRITYKKTDKSSSHISDATFRENISPISVLNKQVNEIDEYDNEDGKVKTKNSKKKEIKTLNAISSEHVADTSIIIVSEEKINGVLKSPDQESNGIKNTSNLSLGIPPKRHDSCSENEKSNQKVKVGDKSKKSIVRKRCNSVSHSENKSKKSKLDKSSHSDNEQTKIKHKTGKITKGDLCSVIFRKCAILEKKSSRSRMSNENLTSAQESNDEIDYENFSVSETSAGEYYSSSSTSEHSHKRVKRSKMSLKNRFARKINLTAKHCDKEPNFSRYDESSALIGGIHKKVFAQNMTENTQNHTAFLRNSWANFSHTKAYRSIYTRNTKGETQLHLACAKRNHSLVTSLLSHGFNPNVKDNAGWTPMHEAVKMECLDTIKELIKYGAYLNSPGFEYETPLYTAIKYNKNNVAALLLQNGADIKCKNIYGNSAQYIDEENWSTLLANYRSPCKSLQIKRSYLPNKCNLFLSSISINKAIVNKFCQRFDIKLIKNIDQGKHSRVTHIIVRATENNTCDANFECLIGLANGWFIVNENWITDSLKYNILVSCENYEVIGTNSFATNGPRKSRLDKEKLRPKLFDGINFHINGHTGWHQFSRNELNKLILEFGGKILKRMPNPEDCCANIVPYHCHNSVQMYRLSTIILYPKESSRLIKYNMEHLKAFPMSWFFEAIQKHSIT